MSFINRAKKEINCKIVYYGPSLSGKTSNIKYLYEKFTKKQSQLQTEERTLFFDFLPLEMGKIEDYKVRFHLYSVPGQPFYKMARKSLLKGVDALIFVADSQMERLEENKKMLIDLESDLESLRYSDIPVIFQWNKRDLPNVVSVKDLKSSLNKKNLPEIECIASQGEGVVETLNLISKRVFRTIEDHLTERKPYEL